MQTENGTKSSSDGIDQNRRKRIQRLKKMILITVASAILLPTVLCIVLGVLLYKSGGEIKLLRDTIAKLEMDISERDSKPSDEIFEADGTEQKDTSDETMSSDNVTETESSKRKVYLTFDDGPSIYTEEILDILSLYEVKATFFVVGNDKEEMDSVYKRIVEEGHSIGMHSYSHKYTEIYESPVSFKEDLNKIRSFIWDKTGVECSLYRFPGGSSNSIGKKNIQEYIRCLEEENIVYYDWNVSSGDATGVPVTVDELVANCTNDLEKYSNAVILLHDSSTKGRTVEALPRIIETILEMENTEIVPITDKTIPVQQVTKE